MMTSDAPGIIGHEAELRAIELFLDPGATATALLLDGEAGIGKTTVLRRGVDEALRRGYLVLQCRPSESEATLPFAALGDLLEPVLDRAADALPPAQHLALETALAIAAPAQSVDRLAVSRAVLALLRGLAGSVPLAVVVDDVQWLDRATAAVIEYAVRRLADAAVLFLVTRRSERDASPPLGLGRALGSERVHSLRVAPLPLGDLDLLLQSRLSISLPRRRLVDLHRITRGNPFYALEIARSAQERGMLLADDLAVPESLAELLRRRLARLSPNAERVVLLAAAAAQPTINLLQRAEGGIAGLDEAIRRSVLEVDGQRLRFSHPLLASVAYRSAAPGQRRAAHQWLAGAFSDPEEKALHLALATDQPDEAVAALLDQAAELASRRGAPSSAADLADHAFRLTPARDDALRQRLAQAAEYHLAEGDTARGRELLEQAIDRHAPGPQRARLLLRLARVRYVDDDVVAAHQLLQKTLAEADGDASLAAATEQALAFTAMLGGNIPRALVHAESSLRLAEQIGDRGLLALALCRVALMRCLAGRALEREMFERALRLEPFVETVPLEWLPSYACAGMATWVGDFETARRLYAELYQTALDRGDERAIPTVLFAMSQLESATGELAAASRHANEAVERSRQSGLAALQANSLSAQTLACALLGQTEAARAAGEEGMQIAARTGAVAPFTWLAAALGFLDLSAGNYVAAKDRLARLAELALTVGIKEPGVLPYLPDAIEALVALGELDQARPLVARLVELGHALDRPWAIATGARTAALLAAAEGDYAAAEAALARALEAHTRLAQPFELGRTLLVAGSIARRTKAWRLAREQLGRAFELFDSIGARLWAEKAAAEAARVPGRHHGGDQLTQMEQRVARLVAQGLSNREVAARLFVAVRTVEANLSKTYAKLGVRSRTELVRRLPAELEPEAR